MSCETPVFQGWFVHYDKYIRCGDGQPFGELFGYHPYSGGFLLCSPAREYGEFYHGELIGLVG